MGEINIPADQHATLEAVGIRELRRLLDRALRSEQSGAIPGLLRNCGPHIAGRLQAFEQASGRHRPAKAARKHEAQGKSSDPHQADTRPDYSRSGPKRKPSAATQEQELQHFLRRTWEDLMRGRSIP